MLRFDTSGPGVRAWSVLETGETPIRRRLRDVRLSDARHTGLRDCGGVVRLATREPVLVEAPSA
jgi:hypothetical protein